LVSCALLHDNALTEYILLEQGREEDSANFGEHCEIGQRNVDFLPFKGNVAGFVLYHHERADGLGPFKLTEGNYPVEAELIATADMLDVERHLQRITPMELPALRENITADIHRRFTHRAGNALLEILDEDMLVSLQDDKIKKTIDSIIPAWTIEMDDPALLAVVKLIYHIIDYKSTFTRIHSQEIAKRAYIMAEYYGYDKLAKIQLYFAAAIHDIGKLAIPNAILDKPGRLSDGEFEIIKTHIVQTRSVLSGLNGMDMIVEWASNHHEKLNGAGYPRNFNSTKLDFNSRLLTCIDIYQAVSEERPYHPRRSHTETMPILYSMAEKGEIDLTIVKDIDKVMEKWCGEFTFTDM
jgi:HD-GYP domain-containing protein (c-di-GMP phosphodiesterase class II)